ncbi:nmrA family protein [Streptomyces laurentii]|uniref:NmrA family protein n=1 Tax=Streptomyces laurentii TaxID=39478 RepID=A0A160P5M3_STRLU|nr:nmrA family protein [Streptomyces laurentii]
MHPSSAHVAFDPIPAMGRWHHARERIVRGSGVPATFLRPGGFMTNALDWLPTIREGGYVLDPVGPGRHAPVDPADIAAVAALALTEDGHQGREYVLTGGELFTVAEQVRILSETIGRDLEVRETATPAEAVRSRFPHGAPPALADALTEGFALMRADTAGFRTDTVERLLGREPRAFRVWCARHADTFRGPESG